MKYCCCDMIYGSCRMIYLLRKHDIISVPSYASAYIIRASGYHRASDITRSARNGYH